MRRPASGRGRRGLRAGAVRGRLRARRARHGSRAARPVRRRAVRQPQLEIFFFSPYFSTEEKKDGLGRMIEGAEETFMSFLETLVERQRMPEIFHIRSALRGAVGRGDEAAAGRGDERGGTRRGDRARASVSASARQTGNKIELTTRRRSRHPRWNRAPRGRLHPRCIDQEQAEPTSQASRDRRGRPAPVKEPLNADQA